MKSKKHTPERTAKDTLQDILLENAHKTIGQNVKKAREQAGLTQAELSAAIGHKSVSVVSCAEIHHKGQHFNVEHLLKIASVLGIDAKEFFEGVKMKG